MTKPEGPAQEPQETSDPSWTKWDLAKVAFPHARESVVPATPVPSQPAAREFAADYIEAHGGFPHSIDELAAMVHEYARQQTAAEIADLRRQRDLEWDSRKAASSGRVAAVRERDSLREANARLAADLDAALKAGKDGQ